MALASVEVRSKLNPNATPFIPAAYQVEDFSPEWWQLVTTSTSYRDFWLSQHEDEGDFYDNGEDDLEYLLPEAFDFDANEDLFNMEAEFQEFIRSSSTEVKEFEKY